jgi:putative addiction module component (TIGR02574 family)
MQLVPPYGVLCKIASSQYGALSMGSPTLENLRAEVMNLSEPDWAELAQQFLASLDGTSDPSAQEMWDTEILRRLAEINAGTAKLVDGEEFRRRLRARMNRR